MSRYLNTDKFPINLFKHFDDVKFKDFGDMLIYFEDNSKTNDFTFSLNKVFQLDSDTIDLFKGILTLFPLSFFSRKESIEFSKLETEIKRNNQIIDFNLLSDLFKININLKSLNSSLSEVLASENCKVSTSNLASEIFIIYYKYSFVQISKSLLLNNEKVSFDELIDTYKIIKEDLALTNAKTKTNKVIVNNLALKQFQYFFTIKGYDVKKIMTEFDILSNKSSLAKLIYIALEQNIRFDDNLSATKKNKLMRPLFYELVCSICYPKHYEYDINNTEVTNKFRDFRNSYKNYF